MKCTAHIALFILGLLMGALLGYLLPKLYVVYGPVKPVYGKWEVVEMLEFARDIHLWAYSVNHSEWDLKWANVYNSAVKYLCGG